MPCTNLTPFNHTICKPTSWLNAKCVSEPFGVNSVIVAISSTVLVAVAQVGVPEASVQTFSLLVVVLKYNEPTDIVTPLAAFAAVSFA